MRVDDPDELRLFLPHGVEATLTNLLSTSLELPKDAQVIDHIGVEPWGDLEEFRRTFFYPLHGDPSPSRGTGEVLQITIPPTAVETLRGVIDRLAEGYSGGVPWIPLDETERGVVEPLLAKLRKD